MTSGIYSITNNVNGKIYIGQTNDLNRREREHFSYLRGNKHSNEHLQSAWNKYGEQNFTFNILKECPIENLDNWERWYISLNKSDDKQYGYNKDKGGNANKIVSEETKRKMRENHYECSGENNPNYGKPRPKEVREKISKTRIEKGIGKGKNNPFYNRKHTEESCRKISENNKGKTAWNKGIKYIQLRGMKNPNAKYELWDNQKVHYHKSRGNGLDIRKCFLLKYDGKDIRVGGFVDFVSPTLINDFIRECDELAV